jgi:hypothetical protein
MTLKGMTRKDSISMICRHIGLHILMIQKPSLSFVGFPIPYSLFPVSLPLTGKRPRGR